MEQGSCCAAAWLDCMLGHASIHCIFAQLLGYSIFDIGEILGVVAEEYHTLFVRSNWLRSAF